MKRTLTAVFLTITLLVMAFAAGATEPIRPIEGEITAIEENAITVTDVELGDVLVHIDENTAFEGAAAPGALAVGQYVYVDYDGKMTRDIPPQITAQKISCFTVSGVVAEILEDGFLVSGDEINGDVIVHADATMPHVYLNVPVTVYFNGVMAMSLPGQISASKIDVPTLSGMIGDVTDESFSLTADDGTEYEVFYNETTFQVGMLADGLTATVYYDGKLTRSIPAQATALEIVMQELPEEAVETPEV